MIYKRERGEAPLVVRLDPLEHLEVVLSSTRVARCDRWDCNGKETITSQVLRCFFWVSICSACSMSHNSSPKHHQLRYDKQQTDHGGAQSQRSVKRVYGRFLYTKSFPTEVYPGLLSRFPWV